MQPTTVHTTIGPLQPPERHPRPTEAPRERSVKKNYPMITKNSQSPLPNTQGWNGPQKAEQLNDVSTGDKPDPNRL